MLDPRRLLVLRAVVDTGSVTAAAAQLGYTPSAVSQQLAALARQAGTALLERAGRGVRPTAAGRLLTEHATAIGRQLARAEDALADLRAGRTGRLAVRYFTTAGAALVPAAVARLRREHPGIRVDLTLDDTGDPRPEVARGGTDLAILVLASPRAHPGIRLVHLLDDPYRVALPRGHRLAARRVVDLAELAGEAWIANEWPASSCFETVLDACATAGFAPTFAMQSEDYATALGFVAAGLGISLVPRTGLGRRPAGVVTRRLRGPEPVRRIFAAVRIGAPDAPGTDALLAALRAVATDPSRSPRPDWPRPGPAAVGHAAGTAPRARPGPRR